jgi:hypothetical protein
MFFKGEEITLDEYQQYLEDQKRHALSGACDDKYLDYLSQVIIPEINLSSLKVLDVGCNKFLSYDYFKNNTMTKKTYNLIGGFTEEWFGRAWADDRMTSLGIDSNKNNYKLPLDFSICWYGQSNKELPIQQKHLYDRYNKFMDYHPYLEKMRFNKPLRYTKD